MNNLHSAVKLTQAEYEALQRKTMAANLPCDIDCPHCGGMGYIHSGVEDRLQKDFGKTTICPRLFAKQVKEDAERFGLNRTEIDLLNWGLLLDLGDAMKTAETIKTVLKKGHGFVYLWGDHGQAKTLLLKIAVAASLRKQIAAAYVNMADLIANLREAFDMNNPSFESQKRLDFFTDLKLLCIDEFNRIKDTDWVKEKRFMLMDKRTVQAVRQETITIIASNDPPSAQESYLKSRFEDGRFLVIEVKGEDARPGMTEDFKF